VANRRCYCCGASLDGGRGLKVLRYDWDRERWLCEYNFCERCFGKLLRRGKR
jgi:hypothetical protein